MRDESEARDDPGHVRGSLTWSDADPILVGFRVEATDGFLGTVVERRLGEGPEHGYLGVATPQGVIYVPDRLIRETRRRHGHAQPARPPTSAPTPAGTSFPGRPTATELPRTD